MKILQFSKNATITENTTPTTDPIHIFSQFFIHRDAERRKEIGFCLRQWTVDPLIETIHLLNERIYTPAELGLSKEICDQKIRQTNIARRLRFSDVFTYIRTNDVRGFHILVNSDICFDATLANLRQSELPLKRQMLAQLRYEYNPTDPVASPIFGPRFESQDTWMFHSNFPIPEQAERALAFEFGKPGCDNKLVYLMNVLGYEVINDPAFVKTYHVHKSMERDYGAKDIISPPWAAIVPAGFDSRTIKPSIGIDLAAIYPLTRGFADFQFSDNTVLYDYILSKCTGAKEDEKDYPFIIPRIAGVENNFAVQGQMVKLGGNISQETMNYFQRNRQTMKNNAGIQLSSVPSIIKYSDMYMAAFQNCELYAGWEPHGDVYRYIAPSHNYIRDQCASKRIVWAFAFDIFHYILGGQVPWTHALRGKRVLIISPFEASIQEKLPIREKIYGMDLFPDCSITTIRPPQTQGSESSEEFDVELAKFVAKLATIRDTYDVALVSCGGYGNLVCNAIFEQGKSAIYVGGVLQMYFGILGSRWLRERPDILRMFMNEHWTRPKDEEKPMNFSNVEGSCYW